MQNSVFSINKEGNHVLTFTSHINIDNGFVNNSQGDHESTMELFLHDDPDTGSLSTKRNGKGSIEWNVETLGITNNIGVWWEHGRLVEYDGVYEFPKEAGKLLNKFGIRVPRETYD